MLKKLGNTIKSSDLLFSLSALVLSLLISGIVIALAGYSPLTAYSALAEGAFGSLDGWAKTLAKSTPLIFTGLAVAFAFRGGLFNIGGEGQLYLGGLTAALVGVYLKGIPGFILLPIALIAAGSIGGAWAAIAALLKVKRNVHEVIVTIMLNYIAIYLANYLVNYPFKAEGVIPRTEIIAKSVQLPRLLPHSQLNAAIFLSIFIAVLVAWFLNRTTTGYEIRAMGYNPFAAETGGVNIGKKIVLTMFISGFLAALAGASEVLGVHGYFIQNFSPGYGFDGVAVAVLGRNHPLGVVVAAFLFGALRSGAMLLDRTTKIPVDFVVLVQALVILFIASPEIIKRFGRGRKGVKIDGR